MKPYRLLKSCRICKSRKLFKFLDLGLMPLPNRFIKKNTEKEDFYPLSCVVCQRCFLVQLNIVIDPRLMFTDYLYVPSTAKMMMNNFTNLAYEALLKFNLRRKDLIIDIGSNDGSLLEIFSKQGFNVLGVDPAKNLAKVAVSKGIRTRPTRFDLKTAAFINKKLGKAKLITATNVVAHIHNLGQLLQGVNHLLDSKGVFITEFPYLLDLIEKKEFDTIYHEHLSYFSLKPWMFITDKYGLEIVDVKKVNIHGGSIRITHRQKKTDKKTLPDSVKFLLDLEGKVNLYDNLTYLEFSRKIEEKKKELIKLLTGFKKEGKRIIGIGAAAKGNVLTNFFNIGTEYLDYIVDSTPYKQYSYTPGKRIPVYPEDKILLDQVDYALVLAWNFKDEIISKHKKFKKKGGKFILPIPDILVI